MRLAVSLGLLLAVPAAAISAVVALALATDDAGSANLIVNGDFSNSDVSAWSVPGGTLAVTADHTGAVTLSASIAFLRQQVGIVPGTTYQFAGQFVASDGPVTWVRPKLIVHDQNGGEIASYSLLSPLQQPGTWSITNAYIPCNASSGLVQVDVAGSTGNVAYLDGLTVEAIDPATPCPTPTPTASDTPTMTPTATKTATASKTPTPTRTPTSTRTPTPQAMTSQTAAALATTPSPTRTPTRTVTPTRSATRSATPTRTATRTATPTLTPANGLLVNGGFEVAADGVPAGWESYGGTLAQVTQPVREGLFAACLSSATTSTKWFYQTVPIQPSTWYEMSAYVYDDDPAVDAAWLRISWYASGDGSGSALWTVDSTNVLDAPQGTYRLLSTGAVQAPPDAHSANARILLRPVSAAPAMICADDAWLVGTAPAPTATPSATATSTTTATATATRTPTRAPAATQQALASATPTPTRTPTVPSTTPPADGPAGPVATPTPAPANDQLSNGGFESGTAPWRTFGGALTQVATPVRSGAYAGAFAVSSGNTSWVYQTVAVDPDGWYELSGYIYQDDPNVEAAFLRLSWYASGDASGSALDSVDSTEVLSAPQPAYRGLTTGPVQSPPDAHSARARILLRPRAAGSAIIYIDDMLFQPAAPPPPGAAPAAPPDNGGAIARSKSPASRAGAPMGGPSSDVLSASQAPEPRALTPQPTPVVRRNGPTAQTQEPSSSRYSLPAWAWVLVGGVAAAVFAGGGTAWWERSKVKR